MIDNFLMVEPSLRSASAEVGNLVAALAKAQSLFPPIPKTKVGKVSGTTKTGSRYEYEYHYADLGDILSVCRPILGSQGIAVVQRLAVTGTRLDVETIMLCGEQWMSETLSMMYQAGNSPAQAVGGLATYLKRYAYSAMVGVQAEEDTDEQRPDAPEGEARRTAVPTDSSLSSETTVRSDYFTGCITPEEQGKLKEGLIVTGMSLQKLLAAISEESNTDVKKLQEIPSSHFEFAKTFLSRAIKE